MQEVFTAPEVEAKLKISRTTLWREIKRGEFPGAFRLRGAPNGGLRIPLNDVVEYAKKHNCAGVWVRTEEVRPTGKFAEFLARLTETSYTMANVEEYLKISRSTMWRLIGQGYFPNRIRHVSGLGSPIFTIPEGDIKQFMQAHAITAAEREELELI